MSESKAALSRYKTIVVDAEAGLGEQRIRLAARLAQRVGAKLIGHCAAQLRTFYPAEDAARALPILVRADREAIESDFAAAKAAFRRTAEDLNVPHEWHSEVASTTHHFALAAKGADLIVVSSPSSGNTDGYRRPNVGDLVMQAGRPLLVVPVDLDELLLNRVLVAWNDSHESRRALSDAVGLLCLAKNITLLSVCANESERSAAAVSLEEVRYYLRHHGIDAHTKVIVGYAEDVVLEQARLNDLVVAGAYGHSRLREWVFGGVTRTLLFDEPTCALLSR